MTIARQLGLDPSTVSNFFMNARRRSVDKWKDENESLMANSDLYEDESDEDDDEPQQQLQQQQQPIQQQQQHQNIQLIQAPSNVTLAQVKQAVLVAAPGGAVAVQQLQPPPADLTSTGLDL